jgi:hypothetical protein
LIDVRLVSNSTVNSFWNAPATSIFILSKEGRHAGRHAGRRRNLRGRRSCNTCTYNSPSCTHSNVNHAPFRHHHAIAIRRTVRASIQKCFFSTAGFVARCQSAVDITRRHLSPPVGRRVSPTSFDYTRCCRLRNRNRFASKKTERRAASRTIAVSDHQEGS